MSETEEQATDTPGEVDWLPVDELANCDVVRLAERRFAELELFHARRTATLTDADEREGATLFSSEAGKVAARLKRIASGLEDAREAVQRMPKETRDLQRSMFPELWRAMELLLTRGGR